MRKVCSCGVVTTGAAQCSGCRTKTGQGRDARRGTTTQRGYGAGHRTLRRQLFDQLAARPGQPCTRCRKGMTVGQQLDLDHTADRSAYLGLAHSRCNRAAGGRTAHPPGRGRIADQAVPVTPVPPQLSVTHRDAR